MAYCPLVDDETFQARVLDAKHPVLVEFITNGGCGLCPMMAPALKRVADEYAGEFALVEIDAEAFPKAAAAFNIQSVPQHLMFAKGRLQERLIGMQTHGRPAEMVEAQLGGVA